MRIFNMNTQIVRNTKVKKLPYFPVLTGQKTTRVITKHFTNCALYLDHNSFSLLSWLIYQSKQDNSFTYSTHLLTKYRESVFAASSEYGFKQIRFVSVQKIRSVFTDLIESGYILPTHTKDSYIINPMLSYRDEYLRASEYLEICKMYQSIQFGTGGDIEEIAKMMGDIINKRIRDKKK